MPVRRCGDHWSHLREGRPNSVDPSARRPATAREVDATLAGAFEGATIAAEPQGWLRDVARDGAVRPRAWASPKSVLSRLQALFVSGADVRGQEAAVTEWVQRVPVAAVTAGARGALLYVNGDRYEVRPRRAREVDATGAGDLFASGFLYGFTHEKPLDHCARLGALAAAEVISHIGARPEFNLADHARKHGLM